MSGWNVAAIALLMGGQVAVLGGIGHLSLGRGDVLVLVATWLWAVEVIICKRLLFEIAPATISLIRMGVGSAFLVAYLAVTGTISILFDLSPSALGWALLTGLLLAAYVGTWMTALARARAIDVTSVLVASTVVTSLLSAVAGTTPVVTPEVFGLVLIALGIAILVLLGRAGLWHEPRRPYEYRSRRPADPRSEWSRPNRCRGTDGQHPAQSSSPRYAYPPNGGRLPRTGRPCGPSRSGLAGRARNGGSVSSGLKVRRGMALPATHCCLQWDRRTTRPTGGSAYWIGNSLLNHVPADALWDSSMIDSITGRPSLRAHGRGGSPWGRTPSQLPRLRCLPLAGTSRAGMDGPPLSVLDRCRIRWGRVETVDGDLVIVRNRVLAFEGSQLVLGDERVEEAHRSLDGTGFVTDLAPGDIVSLHWDWVCDRLKRAELANLQRWTHNLAVVNATACPGPAVAAGT